MRRFELVGPLLGFLIITAGSILPVLTQENFFPFAKYPMYSSTHHDLNLDRFWFYGIMEDGRRVSLHKAEFIYPLSMKSLQYIFYKYVLNGEEESVKSRTASLAQLYHRNQILGRHNEADLKEIQIVGLRWEMNHRLDNVAYPKVLKVWHEIPISH